MVRQSWLSEACYHFAIAKHQCVLSRRTTLLYSH
jgi:hypothetical protein